ncbi:hypothetical protein, partial [Klebsiella pneumoniae]
SRRTLYKYTVYRLHEMFNPSAALFANTMLMFRLMFFHNKKPAEAGFYHVHDRRSAELGGRKQYPPGHEKRQDTGQLP